MIRLAFLRAAVSALLLCGVISCGRSPAPLEPRGSAPAAAHAGTQGFDPVGIQGGSVIRGHGVVVLAKTAVASEFMKRYDLVEVETLDLDGITYRLVRSETKGDVDILALLKDDPEVAELLPHQWTAAPEFEGQPMSFDDGDHRNSSDFYLGQELTERLHLKAAQKVATGVGVRVAILDTGMDLGHPGWAPAPVIPGLDFSVLPHRNDPRERADGRDGDDDGLVDEAYGHGTHVAGIVHLVAPHATLIPVKVLDDEGWGTCFGLAAGILNAMQNGANVVNMSLGLTAPDMLVARAVRYAAHRGVALVASAGNKSSTTVQYPAGFADVYSVTAVDDRDLLAAFANRGAEVDISAPGVGVISLFPSDSNLGAYAAGYGTSMAAPFVSGGTALVKSAFPGLDGRQAAQLVVDAATPIDALNPEVAGLIGQGRIDLSAPLPAAPGPMP